MVELYWYILKAPVEQRHQDSLCAKQDREEKEKK